MDPIEISREDWAQIVDAVRSIPGAEKTPESQALLEYGVCPLSIVDDLTFDLVRLYFQLGGTKRITSSRQYYFETSSLYLAAVEVIEAELAKIRKAKRSADNDDSSR